MRKGDMNAIARAFRATMQQISAFANTLGGYNAGKVTRLTKNFARSYIPEFKIDATTIEQLRAESWNLYRNNPYARKIVRTLESKVVGRGMHPISLAKTIDGKPFTEFREKAREVWWSLQNCADVRGKPGRGGLDMVELQKLALRQVILSGATLARPKTLTARQQKRLGAPIRLAMHMISINRLSAFDKADGFVDGNDWYRGIELNPDGERVAYHLTTQRLDEFDAVDMDVFRVPADEMIHLYVCDDIDQLNGTPWFAPAIFQARDGGDLQYNVLKSSAIAACFVVGYSLASGKSRLGLAPETSSDDLTDSDGNAITKVQPGMMINTGKDGKVEGISPAQPTTNVVDFLRHILGGIGTALPGIKASTVTQDYKGSSFSSERAADNDVWPEMESVQDWFARSFVQPWFEAVIDTAVAQGLFAGVITQEEYADRRNELLDTQWRGPIARSINPTDDEKASQMRVANGKSSPQMECAAANVDHADVIRDVSEWIQQCTEAGWPDWMIQASLGQTKPVPEPQPQNQGAENA